MNRRSFLKTSGIVGATIFTSFFGRSIKAFAETCEKVKPLPQMVTMLGYVAVSKTKGQSCTNCIQYQPGNDKKLLTGVCPIFQGCEVSAKGWCKSWAKKA
jgi:hypothetical protein